MIICLVVYGQVCAQDAQPSPSTSPTPDPNAALKTEKERAELVRDITKARNETLQNSLPKLQATPLPGTTTTKDAIIENEVLAYRSLGRIADALSEKILSTIGKASPPQKTIVIYGQDGINALAFYQGIRTQLSLIEQGYSNTLPAPPPPGVSPCPTPKPANTLSETIPNVSPPFDITSGVISGVAGIISLFNTNVDITGATISIDESALDTLVARSLTDRGVKVYHPSVYPPDLLSLPQMTASVKQNSDGKQGAGEKSARETAEDFCKTIEAAQYGELMAQICVVYALKAQADQVLAAYDALNDAQKKTNACGKIILPLQALNKQFSDEIAGLTTIDQKTGFNPVTALVRAEKLRLILTDNNSYILQLKVQAAGGNNKVTKNLFKGTKLFHSGGSIISYILFDQSGAIKISKTVYDYSGYVKDKELRQNKDKEIVTDRIEP
jgi:hypothetical protein